MPILMIIGDGMGDLPLKELGDKTPLQSVNPRNMAVLTSEGRCGLLEPVTPNIAPDSETAITSILGYHELSSSLSRGPLEALGSGIDLDDKCLACRCNFALVDSDLRVLRDRADVKVDPPGFYEDLRHFCSYNWGVDIVLKRNWRFKAVLTLKGDDLSSRVATPPPSAGEVAARVHPLEDTAAAERTSTLINSIIKESYNILSRHRENSEPTYAANILVPWGVGRKLKTEPFTSRHGFKAACVAGSPLARGIGVMLGMMVPQVEGATGDIDTDTGAKAEAALEICRSKDFVLIHVGGPDEASHDGDVMSKMMIISKIDAMLGRILTEIDLNDNLITLLADHTTSTALRKHTAHPTPIAIAGMGVTPDRVRRYDEQATVEGGLRRILGVEVMPIISKSLR
ncbi:MAG: 2,3-bisphosphoglycerate-independent phosphoglycerate mutase [Candidatus Bathyarchaeia archaeon]